MSKQKKKKQPKAEMVQPAHEFGVDTPEDLHTDPDALSLGLGGLEAAATAWRVAKALEALLTQVNALAPDRSKASDGGIGDAAHASRDSDHNPWVIDGATGVVTARDFTHDPGGGCDAGMLAEGLRTSRDPRIKYIIWNRRICASEAKGGQPPWAWRPYAGSNPHDHHVHVSVAAEKPLYDSIAPWTITSLKTGAAPLAPPILAAAPSSPLSPAAHDAAIAELEAATNALAGLTPLLQRLTELQDSADATVASQAGALLSRYGALARSDLAPQPKPAPIVAPAAIPEQPAAPTGHSYEELQERYAALYADCQVRPEWAGQVAWHRQKLLQYRPKYEPVAAATGAPWWFVGIVHALEGSFNFGAHLHNGDPLTARTVQVPKGRPLVWDPPSDWPSSAIDAITLEGLAQQADWSAPRALFRFEGYNGYGYYAKGINSPYLWSFSNHYAKGKFVADHVYDPDAISKQCGAAVMLKALVAAGDVTV